MINHDQKIERERERQRKREKEREKKKREKKEKNRMRKINDKSLLNKCVAVFFRDAGDNNGR